MGHNHLHSHPHHHHHHHTADTATRNIGVAFWLNLSFAALELVGGWWTMSLAVMSDALHDFGDAVSLGLGYYLQKKSAQGPSENFSYGLRRLSLLSAFITGTIISLGAIFIAIESVRGLSETRSPHGKGMLILAIFGIAMNTLAAWKLSHGHTHNERMLKWHLIEDILGWVAVLIGGIFILLFKWTWLDAALALAISVFVLYNVVKRVAETVNLFLQGNPDPIGLKSFRDKVEALAPVEEIHDVHFWSLDGVRHVLSMHVVLKDLAQAAEIKDTIRDLSSEIGDCHITIEVESTQEHCHDDCEHVHA